RYDIQAINTTAREILGIHVTALGDDFVHLARGVPSERLRGVIDQAFQGRPSVERVQLMSVDDMAQGQREIEISGFPQRAGNDGADRVTVVLSDVTVIERERRDAESIEARQQEEF